MATPEEIELAVSKEIGKESVSQVFSFLHKLIGAPLEELGNLLADKIKYRRLVNQIKCMEKFSKLVQERNIQIKSLPFKFVNQFLDKTSTEEDDYMRNKWAALLANTSDSQSQFEPENSFINLLDQLSPREALLLDKFYDEVEKSGFNENYHIEKDQVLKFMKVSDSEYYVMIGNLRRLNILRSPYSSPGTGMGGSKGVLPFTLASDDDNFFTQYGMTFVRHCR